MSKFQQRHYEAIAEVLQMMKKEGTVLVTEEQEVWDDCVKSFQERLTDLFFFDNGMFSSVRFERACQPGANVKARTK